MAPHPHLRKWLKRLGWAALGLALVVALFHRPLIFEGTRYFVVRAAKQQHLALDYQISGSIFSTLSISKLTAKPTEPGPIQRLEIGSVNLRYSLWDAVRKGLPALLKVVELKDVYVDLTPAESPPAEPDAAPQQLKFPALFPELLNLENINFTSHAQAGDTVVEGLFFSLLPDRPGELKVTALDIPGVRKWAGIAARTSFRDRNLLLTELHIGPEIALQRFRLDASRLDEAELRAGLEGTFFGAPASAALHITDLNRTNRLDVQAAAAGLDFDAVFQYLSLPPSAHGRLRRLSAVFHGAPGQPAGWNGRLELDLGGLEIPSQKLGDLRATADLEGGRARAAFTAQIDARNRIDGWLAAALPREAAHFARTDATAHLKITAPHLASLGQPVGGSAFVRLDARLADETLHATVSLDAPHLSANGANLTHTSLRLQAEKALAAKSEEPIFSGLATTTWLEIASIRYGDYETDALTLEAATKGAEATLKNLSLRKGRNRVDLQARYTLPADLKSFPQQPVTLDLALNAPELGAFLAPDSSAKLTGALDVKGRFAGENGIFDGSLTVAGRGIRAQGIAVRTVDGRVQVVKNRARIPQMAVVLNDQNSLRIDGEAELKGDMPYHGRADVALTDLSKFQPLLGKTPLAGDLKIAWQGEGDARAHRGSLSLDLARAQFGDQKNLTAHIAANYAPDYIDLQDLRASAGTLGAISLTALWKEKRLRLSNLLVRQQQLTLLEGSLEAPLDLGNLKNPIPLDQPLALTLRTKDLKLHALLAQLGQKEPAMSGTVNLAVTASGTVRDLTANVQLRADRLQSTAASEMAPADIAVDLNLRDDRLALNGTLRQKWIEPLTLSGSLPLDAEQLAKKRALDPATPVILRANLPRSSLAFVSSLIPMIRQSRGTAAVDVRIDGTIARPALAGSVDVNWSALRFADPSLPPLNDFGLRIGFTKDRLTIDHCRGGLAGGSFAAAGGIDFARLDRPIFNLRFATREALVLQNDDLTARISGDVRVAGPMDAATVSGNVFVTRSRFFKDIDILPIGLPGRPAPQPPAEPATVSFPQPPLRDWKFNLRIQTADPFLVESNLARGKITMDLRLGGTGLAPWLEGNVRIEQLTASLPFSRLNIADGTVFFTRDAPFSPQLNIRGTSEIRDYNVAVTIYGSASDPQAVFSSDPPLPQADVVALIATGTTTEELGRDPNALAGQAAMLAFQKLYRTVFKPKPGAERKDTFLSKVQFDIGGADPKTGRQSLAARLPLTDQFSLLGGVDVGGNFLGQVKYFIRFR